MDIQVDTSFLNFILKLTPPQKKKKRLLGFTYPHINSESLGKNTKMGPEPIVINGVTWGPYKCPYKWVTWVITLLIGVITPFIISRGPICINFTRNRWGFKPSFLAFSKGEFLKKNSKGTYSKPNANPVQAKQFV